MLDEKICKAIRGLRKEKGLTQKDLAEISNIDKSYIGKIERQVYRNLTVQTLEKLIESLGCTDEEFFRYVMKQEVDPITMEVI
ncbi:MAG: helix-turn-helix transcriptional regulator [Aerococcus sp.]|nr:helix-turn-helix transcriptional regulator [Aerococcus sp.]